jgi:hypothetical protein
LKRTLKVRRSAVNCTVYFELGQVPMYVERYYRMSSKNATASLTKQSITLCLNSHKNLSSSTTSWEIHISLKPYLHRISLILPAQLNFLFGCETWGSHKGEVIEKVHLNFL